MEENKVTITANKNVVVVATPADEGMVLLPSSIVAEVARQMLWATLINEFPFLRKSMDLCRKVFSKCTKD